MAKSKNRLVADFMGKVQADPTTGEAIQADVQAVASNITGTTYNQDEVNAMFDDVIAEIENLATNTAV